GPRMRFWPASRALLSGRERLCSPHDLCHESLGQETSARLAPRNHLVGGSPMRTMMTMLTAIISPATLPPTEILLIFMPASSSSAAFTRFSALPPLLNVPLPSRPYCEDG